MRLSPEDGVNKFKIISLVVLGPLAVWALWPPARESASTGRAEKNGNPGDSATDRRFVIRMAPRFYMPGTMPANTRKPLRGLELVGEKFEALVPDTHVEFVDVPTGVREWLVTQLSAGQAPDIMQAEVEDVWQDVHKGWYVPLDKYLDTPNAYIDPGKPGSRQWWDLFKYQGITRGKAGPDGKMYSIIFDMVETGIFYNKDIFRKVGVEPPKDWEEFLEIQQRLKDAGYIPMLANSWQMADWGVDLVFDQLYYPILPGIDLNKDPIREVYLEGYLDWDEIAFLYEKGFFTRRDPRYLEVWRLLHEWRQYWNKDISPEGVDSIRLFFTQRGAMHWDSSMFVQTLLQGDLDFDWDVFYLPPMTKKTSRHADGHPMCVIGGAAMQYSVTNSAFKDTGDPETSERLKRVIAFLQFMTLPENTDTVVNEVTFFLPNIKGVEPKPVLQPFHEFLLRRYTTTKWSYTFDLRFNEILNRMLELYMNGGIDQPEFLEWMEGNLDAAVSDIVRRKKIRFDDFEAKWQELEPVRGSMEDLPRE